MHDDDAPLLDAWRRFVESDVAPFTIPGHKRRAAALWPSLGRLLDVDVPLFGGLDTMKDAVATLAVAERRGAELWGADWCRYSTGGSTHVNQAIALAVGRPGDTVLVTRNAHRSTLSGLILAGLEPVWLPSAIDTRLGLPVGLDLDALGNALAAHPTAVGVFCVEPSYVGTLSDLPAVVELAHARAVPVIVDQAWGAHLGHHDGYPRHALQAGADAMITSAHKALPAFSQASILLARTGRIDADRLDRAFDALATTSPSGAILASIDASRALLQAPAGAQLLGRLHRTVAEARVRLGAAGFTVLGPGDFAADRFDPAKLVLRLDDLDGTVIERALLADGVPVELADRDTIVAMVTMLDDAGTLDRLCATLSAAAAERRPRERAASTMWTATIPPAVLPPRAAFFAAHESVPAAAAVGRVSAELIAPYPPGIPVLVPGELITEESVAVLAAAAAAGTRIAYAHDSSLQSYQVVVEQPDPVI